MSVPALYTRHLRWALSIAPDYWLPGADRKDVDQELRIALWIACRDFDPGRGFKFKTFARVVIHRRLADKVREATALKNRPLTDSIREGVGDDGDMVAMVELLAGGRDPLEEVLERERLEQLVTAYGLLTAHERASLARVVHGGACPDKRVHNAAYSARRKLKAALAT